MFIFQSLVWCILIICFEERKQKVHILCKYIYTQLVYFQYSWSFTLQVLNQYIFQNSTFIICILVYFQYSWSFPLQVHYQYIFQNSTFILPLCTSSIAGVSLYRYIISTSFKIVQLYYPSVLLVKPEFHSAGTLLVYILKQ